ncbi:MAG: hypothetical protein V3W37_10775, partial [Candidatus Binatia bacterium]
MIEHYQRVLDCCSPLEGRPRKVSCYRDGLAVLFLEVIHCLDIKFFLCYLSITLRGQGGNVRKLSRIDNQIHKQISIPKIQKHSPFSKQLKVFFLSPSKYLNFPGNI